MKKWEVLNTIKLKNGKLEFEDIIQVLLQNKGLKTKQEIEVFLNPQLSNVTIESVGIDKNHLKKSIQRILKAITNKEQIVVFGDYDVDGICASAIIWEALHGMDAKIIPYIPHRIDEGYGLSKKGIDGVLEKFPDTKIIITVDNGIVANDSVEYANKKNIDVILTDHHVPSETLPNAYAIVHTTKLCGTGVAWMLTQAIWKSQKDYLYPWKHLELVALATVADLVPLQESNRILLKYGLKELRDTTRPGLLALFQEAILKKDSIGVYEIGHMIAPRLNAMGRLEYAMDSLRLLCTKDVNRAKMLAALLGTTNKERQLLTQETALHAVSRIKNQEVGIKKLLFIAHDSYQPGIIGLVAGKLVEEFYRPSIVLSIGETHSKASARSVHGFNIIEFIRSASEFLVDAGGHPMAAGFTVENSKIPLLQEALEKLAHETLTEDMLVRNLKIDYELPLSLVSEKLYNTLQQLQPFGMGNTEPTFASRNVKLQEFKLVGKDQKHLKLKCEDNNCKFDAIAFGMGELSSKLKEGASIDIAYSIDMDTWNGNRRLQLKIKDIKLV